MKDTIDEIVKISKENIAINSSLVGHIYACLDITDLSSDSSFEKTTAMCRKIIDMGTVYNYPAAVCVFPSKANIVHCELAGTPVKTAVVAAGFPHGQINTESKLFEIESLVAQGIDEIDVVINIPQVLAGNLNLVAAEIQQMKAIMPKTILKVIIEVSLLNNINLIYKAGYEMLAAGADFIKTSSGKDNSIANPEAVATICLAIEKHCNNTGLKKGIKIAGGVSNLADAVMYRNIVEHILSNLWLTPSLFRIGTSSLQHAIEKFSETIN